MAKRDRNRPAAPVAGPNPAEEIARQFVGTVADDLDRAMSTMVDETMVDETMAVVDTPATPVVNDYDPTAPVDGVDVAAAIVAGAAAIAAARIPIPVSTPIPTGVRPRWNAPGIPAGLPPVGTMISTPHGACEIRHWASRIEYDDAPKWGNLSCSMITVIDDAVVGDHGIVPIGTRVRSSRGRTGTVREIFAVVRDPAGRLHNVSSARITGTRPAAGPHGTTMTPVMPLAPTV